ncbi:MAG: hypothetical protein P8Z40_01380 [Chloroflexota bacterium]
MEASDRGFPRVYVLMPFGDEFNQIYSNLILPALGRCEVDRAGDLTVQHNALGYIIQSVADADLVVADLTGLHPFVLYELGIAHALAKPSILLTQHVDELPFDLRPRMVAYSTYFADVDHLRHTLHAAVTALVEGTLVEYSNPVMDYVPALFNGMASYPQTATLERLLNVVSTRLEMARMAEAEAAEVVVKDAKVVEEPVEEVIEEVFVVEEPVEEVIDEVTVVEEPPVVEEAPIIEEAPVAEEMAVEAAEESPVAEAVEEAYVEVEEAVEEEAVEEAYAEVEEAAEAVEDGVVEEAAEEEAVEEAYSEVEEVAEEAVEETPGESREMTPDKVLFMPFVPADAAGDEVDDEEAVTEEMVVEAADEVEAETPAASGNGYGEAVEAEAEVEAEAGAEAYGITAAGLDTEEADEETSVEEAPIDSEADAETADGSASYEDVEDAEAEMDEEAAVEAETAPESEVEPDGEEPESGRQDTDPWAY